MSTLRITGPTPDDGRQWCAACVMLAKQELHDEHMDGMREALADGKNGAKLYHVTPRMIEHAVTVAVWGDEPNMPAMPVCWSHVAGIILKAKSALEVPSGTMQLPKGLIKGQG